MSSAFVLTSEDRTMGILSSCGKGLLFEASHLSALPLQHRRFSSPEAARDAVEKLLRQRGRNAAVNVSANRVW